MVAMRMRVLSEEEEDVISGIKPWNTSMSSDG